MRALATAALTAVTQRLVATALLIKMELTDGTVYLSSAMDIEHASQVWLGAGRVGSISTIESGVSEKQALRFTLSSVPSTNLSFAMTDSARAKRVTILQPIFDGDTMAILDVASAWTGSINQVSVQEGGGKGSVSATAEHRGTTYARPKPLRYTDGDQQRINPGDRGLRFVVAQANTKEVWPAASFFRE